MIYVALSTVLALAALLQFFVSFCHSVVVRAAAQELSDQGREAAGIQDHIVSGEDFKRLLQLINLCPDVKDGQGGMIRTIRVYFGTLNIARGVLRRLLPTSAAWIESERASCAWYAAVALDQRIAYWREQVTKQDAYLS